MDIPKDLPETWKALLRQPGTWKALLYMWSLPVSPIRLAEIRAERLLERS